MYEHAAGAGRFIRCEMISIFMGSEQKNYKLEKALYMRNHVQRLFCDYANFEYPVYL